MSATDFLWVMLGGLSAGAITGAIEMRKHEIGEWLRRASRKLGE